jgi:hypothetical protein
MKVLKIFGIVVWSIFLLWELSLITRIGLDEFENKTYLYIDMELNKGHLFLCGLAILFILVILIFVMLLFRNGGGGAVRSD